MHLLKAYVDLDASLNEKEVEDFLGNNKLNIHIGSIGDKGHPFVHPTWYYYDPSKQKLYITKMKDAKTTRNLQKNSVIYFCIDDPNVPPKGVRGKGTIKIHEDFESYTPIAEKIVIRYLNNLEDPRAKNILGRVREGNSIIMEITPFYLSTWDDDKLKVT